MSEDEFNEKLAACNTESERAQLITDTLNGLYSESGEAYRDNNSALIEYREAQDAMNQAMSDLGTVLMPIVTDITNFGTSLIEDCQPGVQWFKDNLPAIKDTFIEWAPAIAGVVGAFLAFQAVSAVAGVINTVKAAMDGMTLSQTLLNAAMNANPIVLIVTLIAGLVVALVTLWNTNEGFRNAVISAWNSVSATASAVWGAIVNFFTVTVPGAIQTCIGWFSQLPGNIANFLGSVISSVGSWVGNMASSAASAASQFAGNLINGLASLPGRVVQVGSNIIQGLVNGITGGAQSVINAIGGVVNDAIGWAKSLLGIASPSKVFAEIGDFTMQGFEVGMDRKIDSVVDEAKKAAQEVTKAFNPQLAAQEQGAGLVGRAGDTVSKVLSVVDGRSAKQAASTTHETNINYFIGDTKVDTITEQKFAEEFIGLMTKYGRLAVT